MKPKPLTWQLIKATPSVNRLLGNYKKERKIKSRSEAIQDAIEKAVKFETINRIAK